MDSAAWTDDELVAYLDEMLPPERMAELETALRESEDVRRRVATAARRRDQGAHTVGEIWRRQRLSCPSRTELGSFLLGTLSKAETDYMDFHLRTIGCRFCVANLADLQEEIDKQEDTPRRRRRFFESSAGLLNPE